MLHRSLLVKTLCRALPVAYDVASACGCTRILILYPSHSPMTQIWNSNTVQRFGRTSPLLAMASVGFVLAGCTPSGDSAMDGASSSMAMSSADAMMMQSSSLAAAAMDGKYVSGTYAATGDYTSPAGAEQVDITITLDGNVITAATFTGKAEHPASKKWQGNFSQGFAAEVVGKSIDEVKLGVVNGSSLAPKGFMDALAKIQADAQA